MQCAPHMSTPHLCSANRSIFTTGRRSVQSAGGNRINAATPSEQPKGKVISTLAIICSRCIKGHFLPRLAQNTVCFSEFWGLTMEQTTVSLQVNQIHLQNTHMKRIPHLLKMCLKIKHVQTFAKHVHQFGLGGTVTKNLILKQ